MSGCVRMTCRRAAWPAVMPSPASSRRRCRFSCRSSGRRPFASSRESGIVNITNHCSVNETVPPRFPRRTETVVGTISRHVRGRPARARRRRAPGGPHAGRGRPVGAARHRGAAGVGRRRAGGAARRRLPPGRRDDRRFGGRAPEQADIVVRVGRLEPGDVAALREGCVLVGWLWPRTNPELVQALCDRRITAFGMESIPRATRAQRMDALSSQATVSGYRSVILAAETLPKFFPMLMTAAGTVAPAKVLVLGAGVAGLQAIATARRLGAVVSA